MLVSQSGPPLSESLPVLVSQSGPPLSESLPVLVSQSGPPLSESLPVLVSQSGPPLSESLPVLVSQSGPPLSESLPVLVSQSGPPLSESLPPPLQPATAGASTAMSAKAKAMLAHVNCNSNSPQLQPIVSQACRTPQAGAALPRAIRTFSLSGGIRKCPVGPRPRKGELSDGAG